MDQLQQQPQQPLPNATPVLVLGILSIVLCLCYGIIGLALGIVALILAAKSKKLYADNPELYTQASYKNLNAGRICAIIGVILSVLFIAYIIFIIALVGFENLGDPTRMMERMNELKK
jgi:M penetrans paralogue family 26